MIQELDKKIIAYGLSERRILLSLQTSVTVDYFHPDYKGFATLLFKCFDKFREVPTERVMREFAGEKWNDDLLNIYNESLEIEIDPKEFPLDLDHFKIRYNKQLLLKFGQDTFRNNYNGEDFEDLEAANLQVKKLSSAIDSAYGNKAFKEGSLSEMVEDSWEEYKMVRDNPESVQGIKSGFSELDRIASSFVNELILIGGESSSGKSCLAMNMAINAWLGNNVPHEYESGKEFDDSGADVIYFSIEMPIKSLRRRVNANVSNVPVYGIRDGNLNEQEVIRYKNALRFQRDYPKQLHIFDVPRNCTIPMIESFYLEKCYDMDPKLIIIDYISLMKPDRDQNNDWLNLGALAAQMHELTRKYEIPIISPVQLNRPPKGPSNDSIPDQHRVGRSAMLVDNANIVLNIATRKDEELRPDMVVRIAKMRDGERGNLLFQKRFDVMKISDSGPNWTPDIYDGYGEG